eukprot:2095937-Rhodomonas_salina.1
MPTTRTPYGAPAVLSCYMVLSRRFLCDARYCHTIHIAHVTPLLCDARCSPGAASLIFGAAAVRRAVLKRRLFMRVQGRGGNGWLGLGGLKMPLFQRGGEGGREERAEEGWMDQVCLCLSVHVVCVCVLCGVRS